MKKYYLFIGMLLLSLSPVCAYEYLQPIMGQLTDSSGNYVNGTFWFEVTTSYADGTIITNQTANLTTTKYGQYNMTLVNFSDINGFDAFSVSINVDEKNYHATIEYHPVKQSEYSFNSNISNYLANYTFADVDSMIQGINFTGLNLSDLNSTLGSMGDLIVDINSTMATSSDLSTNMSSMENNISIAYSLIGDLNGSVTSNSDKIVDINATLATLSDLATNISMAETNLTILGNELAHLNTSMSAEAIAMNWSIEANSENITLLYSTIAGNISTMENNVSIAYSLIADLNYSVVFNGDYLTGLLANISDINLTMITNSELQGVNATIETNMSSMENNLSIAYSLISDTNYSVQLNSDNLIGLNWTVEANTYNITRVEGVIETNITSLETNITSLSVLINDLNISHEDLVGEVDGIYNIIETNISTVENNLTGLSSLVSDINSSFTPLVDFLDNNETVTTEISYVQDDVDELNISVEANTENITRVENVIATNITMILTNISALEVTATDLNWTVENITSHIYNNGTHTIIT